MAQTTRDGLLSRQANRVRTNGENLHKPRRKTDRREQLVYLGVNIAKSYLDAAIGNEKRRFSNDTIGQRELIKWVKQLSAPVQVICESSGGYERALVQALARARVKISLVQANRVRQFARAAGILAKTDRIRDCELLASRPKLL